MSNIRVDVGYTIKDGTEIKFRSPVDCSAVTGLIVYYPGADGSITSKVFAFADAHGNNVGNIDHLFAEDVVVKVILDVTKGMAFVQNADTNAYLEAQLAGKAPAGYGLGTTAAYRGIETIAELDNIKVNGKFLIAQTAGTLSLEGIAFNILGLDVFMTDNTHGEQSVIFTDGRKLRRVLDGEWQSWTDISPSAFAPSGYGLGGEAKKLTGADDLNNVWQSGNYWWDSDIPVNAPVFDSYTNGMFSFMRVDGLGDGTFKQTVWSYYPDIAGQCMTRYCTEEWEWVNPPMIPSIEYRTTERWDGKSVYVVRKSMGKPNSNGRTEVSHSLDEGGCSGIVRHTCAMYCGANGLEQMMTPVFNTNSLTNVTPLASSFVINGGSHIVMYVQSGADMSYFNRAEFTVWFTKD